MLLVSAFGDIYVEEDAGVVWVIDTWALEAPDLGTISVPVTAPDDAAIDVSGVDASSALNEGVLRNGAAAAAH